MSLDAAVREAESRVQALRAELARDEALIAKYDARTERAERNVEQWWFGASPSQRIAAFVRWLFT
ncbi:MAG: hypothetical protein JNK82_01170 [Myxococcaceae bacterium]|nr:hypothetical protein [Myxococcaceae bacterium]